MKTFTGLSTTLSSRKSRGLVPIRQMAPKIEATAQTNPGSERERRQAIDCVFPSARQTLVNLVYVLR
ncbi:hypothetical protein P7B04_08405 [Sphingobium yanoikuyae]|uniref:hypothetical protein n=1 Tax=Sphingobium yanoikuyae TaxID=13690 RepID=UPI002410AA52|nr:hypothetical protein [Sphingobium yanoikuyae]MDG2512716.1 hypothetical protein [Sphingobium yanoikuyae]